MYTLELNGSRVHKVVVGMTNGSGDGRLRGIGTDKESKKRKEESREESGRREERFFFQPPLKDRAPFFPPHPIKKIPFQEVDK